jgi:hypothetical protein
VSKIRILLVGVPAMLTEIISTTISTEPTMRIVSGAPAPAEIGAYTRRKHINAVIFMSENSHFDEDGILDLLRVNPRLCLLGLDGLRNRAILHRLAPWHERIDDLAQPTLVSAIYSGTMLRLG